MTDLIPVTAFHGATPRSRSFGALSLSENTGLGLASLALRKGQAPAMPFGLTLPEVARVTSAAGYGAFWVGPGQWMITAEGKAETDLAAALKSEVPGASVTEQTDGFVVFEITSDAGPALIEALMVKLVNIDPKTLGPGHATRTGLHHMTVYVIRDAAERLTIIGMRTLAGSLWHALSGATKSVAQAG